MSARYTADQLEEGIAAALRAGDMPAAVEILQRLTVVDAKRAQDVLDVMRAGIVLSKRAAGGERA